MTYKIAIVDDRSQNRLSLAEKINYSGEVMIVLMANNGKDYLEKMKVAAPAARPDIVLMDIDMPVMNGIEAVRSGAILYPDVKYIMLTVFDDDDKLFDAIQAGAHGYLLKEERVDVILAGIHEVMEQEGAPMSPRIARKALALLTNANVINHPKPSAPTNLSDREMEILKELVNGLDYKEIAAKLFLSPHTVRKHIAHVYEKLQVTSKAQAVKLAVKNKWA